MEPRQPGLSGGFEHRPPAASRQGEFAGESSSERFPDVLERKVETASTVERESTPPVLPALPTPLQAAQDDSSASQPALIADDAISLDAADQDLIEKEWVEKAKRIINETRDDPYKREQEVSKLQIEYIRKRYGREIGEAGTQ